jgi:8-oxo-dGTP pyrophosphatase MutT (NUDIX family)
MTRAQGLVHRGNRVLMVKHRMGGSEWWCLPGGGIEPGETPEEATLRELKEECCVTGVILCQTNHVVYAPGDDAITFLIDIGDQEPHMGNDPEFAEDGQILAELRWLTLAEIPERDRAFLWAAGLLGVPEFCEEIENWGDDISYPSK